MVRSTQFGMVTILALGGGLVLTQVIAGASAWHPVAIFVAAVLALALVLMPTLSVEVDSKAVRCWFGPGLIRRAIPLEQIRSARAVRNRWFYGWGIRLIPHGWMFNVSGLAAVELELRSGRCFRIGTNQPEELARAIERHLAPQEPGQDPPPSRACSEVGRLRAIRSLRVPSPCVPPEDRAHDPKKGPHGPVAAHRISPRRWPRRRSTICSSSCPGSRRKALEQRLLSASEREKAA